MSFYLKYPENLPESKFISVDFFKADIGDTADTITNTVSSFVKSVLDGSEAKVDEKHKTDYIKKVESAITDAKEKINNTLSNGGKDVNVESVSVEQTKSTFKGAIYLPIPNNVSESLQHDWQQSNGLVKTALSTFGGDGVINNAEAIAKDVFNKALGKQEVLVNPDYVQTYNGTGLRTLELSWTFVPNNKREAEAIFDIIRKLKATSSPTKLQGAVFITAPLFCRVTFNNDKLENSMRYDIMVITNISVNYSEAGFMETFYDGNPKSINLAITLAERKMKTSSDWDVERNSKDERSGYIKDTSKFNAAQGNKYNE